MLAAADRHEQDPPPFAAPTPPARFRLPRGAVDTHAHVIGTRYIENRSYTPTPAPATDYLAMLDAVGMDRGVLVQVSVHGTDNSLMLGTVRANPQRLRGVAVVSHDEPEHKLRAMKDAGIVGLRLNTTTGGGVGISRLRDYAALCAELGWHIQFLVEPHQLDTLRPQVARLHVPAVFDHMGYARPGADMAQARRTLVQLVRDGAWVKLSGAFRLTRSGSPYQDTVALAQELIEAGPARCVWGSDWPHVSFRGPMPDPGALLDLLADWAPDEQARDAILVSNPQRLYGFPDLR
ncbi:MAG: amidohydrolase family protein [Xenophilus sp.]